jgi:hypothetical protein
MEGKGYLRTNTSCVMRLVGGGYSIFFFAGAIIPWFLELTVAVWF